MITYLQWLMRGGVAGDTAKVLAGLLAGWFLHVGKERYGRRELRNALYRELANNYEALLYNCAEERVDFDWLRDNLCNELSFHAYKKAALNPEALYRIPEHGWLQRCFKELEKCTTVRDYRTLSGADKEFMTQLQRAVGCIQSIAPPANVTLLKKMLAPQYAKTIK